MAAESRTIDFGDFYYEFQGHRVQDLQALLCELRDSSDSLIWLAGDSSLDNKYWFRQTHAAVGAYKNVLSPPTSVTDIAFWINEKCEREHRNMASINTAVEATTLNERSFILRPQDKFLRDNIERDDILVVSVGGNDVALLPCPCTIASVLGMLCVPLYCIEEGFSCGAVPVDDCCCGCGPSLASCACSCPPCLGYLRHLFGTRVEGYIKQLTKRTTPKKILVCMIYYPDESLSPSWAGAALAVLGYNRNPTKLQSLLRKMFAVATSNIRISGAEVIPVALFNVLDGKHPEDYIARVEPSPIGGQKIADRILDVIDQSDSATAGEAMYLRTASSPPPTSYMIER